MNELFFLLQLNSGCWFIYV